MILNSKAFAFVQKGNLLYVIVRKLGIRIMRLQTEQYNQLLLGYELFFGSENYFCPNLIL